MANKRSRPGRSFERLEHRNVLAISIMPIGDSLSSGLAPADANRMGVDQRASYRPELWDLIQTELGSCEMVEFVGTSTYNPSNLAPEAAAHSSYRGFATLSFLPNRLEHVGSEPDGEINDNLKDADGWGTIHPDFALLLLGTNDLLGNRRISSIEDDLKRIVVELREDRRDVNILLGTLPPYDSSRTQVEFIPEMNTVIRNLVHPDGEWIGSTEQSPIHIVDHYNGVGDNPAFDLALHSADGVHPNPAGDALLAANWWAVLEPLLEANGDNNHDATVPAPADPFRCDEVRLAGDANNDGEVGFEDFLVVSANFDGEGSLQDGDFNADGIVNVEDFLILSANFGEKRVAVEPTATENERAMVAATDEFFSGREEIESCQERVSAFTDSEATL